VTRRTDPLAETRIRLEGRLEDLEAAEEEYEACARRRTPDWRQEEVEALQRLESRTRRAREALAHLFRNQSLPLEEAALLSRVARARDRFLFLNWKRMTGSRTPPDDTSQAQLFALLEALHPVVGDRYPIYQRMKTPTFSWWGPPRLACRLSKTGLISEDRFITLSQLLELGVRRVSHDEAPDQCWVGDHELANQDMNVVSAAVTLLKTLTLAREAAGPREPGSWVIGGAQVNAPPMRPSLYFTARGAVFTLGGIAPTGLDSTGFARILDGFPADEVDRHLRLGDAEVLPLDAVRSGLTHHSADRLRLTWNAAELEVVTAPGDAARLVELMGL
jgi:hypothetical protein